MVIKAKENNVLLRPHFKTHQSAKVAEWFKEYGVECITVSSVKMAEYFANHGWKDITIAFPANILEWKEINTLANSINVNIVVESIESILFLESKLTSPVGVYIKVDTGYGRTGINADDFETILNLLKRLKNSKNLIFIGYLCHAGHTYNTSSIAEIEKINKLAKEQLLALKTFMASEFPLAEISFGDTPSCSILNDFSDYHELRPGNFVFYDLTQHSIGSCKLEDIAVALAVPVVAKHPKRNEIIVHGGAVHLSKDSLKDKDGNTYYGIAVKLNGNKWDVNKKIGTVVKVSQEHGIIKVEDHILKEVQIGDLIAILPIHSCLTANLMKEYQTTDGENISMMI
ncbi:alanine racemase [Carboxylicivirga linearis]|uniref:Alanine racemase n=2 Tax=Carboxylicivirga linearis TaxID=1628157 RepID=A0ABS5K0L8_9BACT|nr:alanine racemase [Carboxylicivirga linearis]